MPDVQNVAANLQIEYRPLAALEPYANNARQHSKAQIEQIADSIRRFGFTNPVLLDGENGVIAGHGRILGAALLGLEDVPCIELRHLTADEKRAYIIADNQLALTATWSEDLLRSELGALKESDFPLSLTGFSPEELDSFLKEVAPAASAPPEAPKSLGAELNEKWNVRPGDLWTVGPHRLLCGDSTLTENVERLMAGERAALVHADPPYSRVNGEDRWEHATPKPVDLVMRAIKSSTPEGATILAPFAGSGSDFVAAQTLGRKCRGMEISPDYCALILERMTSVFPQLEANCDR